MKKRFIASVLAIDILLLGGLSFFLYRHFAPPSEEEQFGQHKSFHGTVQGYFFGKWTDHYYMLIWHPATRQSICFRITENTILSDEIKAAWEENETGIAVVVESAEWISPGYDFYPAELIVLDNGETVY